MICTAPVTTSPPTVGFAIDLPTPVIRQFIVRAAARPAPGVTATVPSGVLGIQRVYAIADVVVSLMFPLFDEICTESVEPATSPADFPQAPCSDRYLGKRSRSSIFSEASRAAVLL